MNVQKIERLHQSLKNKGFTLATAESMTAGLVASTIASVPGASSVLLGGIVCYSSEVKKNLLKVDESLIKTYSAESAEVTNALVKGLMEVFNPNVGVAITGVAGSSVNSYETIAESGSVFIAIAIGEEYHEFKVSLSGDRNEIREKAVEFIVDTLINLLQE